MGVSPQVPGLVPMTDEEKQGCVAGVLLDKARPGVPVTGETAHVNRGGGAVRPSFTLTLVLLGPGLFSSNFGSSQSRSWVGKAGAV